MRLLLQSVCAFILFQQVGQWQRGWPFADFWDRSSRLCVHVLLLVAPLPTHSSCTPRMLWCLR